MKNCEPRHWVNIVLSTIPRLKLENNVRTIGIWASIGHRQDPRPDKPELGMNLVGKLVAIDTRPAPACARGITSLDHEPRYYTVEHDAVVVAPFGQFGKVGARLHHHINRLSLQVDGARMRLRDTPLGRAWCRAPR